MVETNHSESSEKLPDRIIVTDVLDLHGFFPEQIPSIIHDFIQNAVTLKIQTVRIVHGKGKSRLKYEVLKVLKSHPDVMDFRDAPPYLGSWGTTLVTLKNRK